MNVVCYVTTCDNKNSAKPTLNKGQVWMIFFFFTQEEEIVLLSITADTGALEGLWIYIKW